MQDKNRDAVYTTFIAILREDRAIMIFDYDRECMIL